MSSLWTPGGERPVGRDPETEGRVDPPASPTGEPEAPFTEESLQARASELREQLARTPADVVIANHAYAFFELAALHLSLSPPQLDQARLAIDALGAVVDGLGSRLGESAAELSTGLGQLRMAFVQVHAAQQAGAPPPSDPPSGEAG